MGWLEKRKPMLCLELSFKPGRLEQVEFSKARLTTSTLFRFPSPFAMKSFVKPKISFWISGYHKYYGGSESCTRMVFVRSTHRRLDLTK